jgi:hypothetical protein
MIVRVWLALVEGLLPLYTGRSCLLLLRSTPAPHRLSHTLSRPHACDVANITVGFQLEERGTVQAGVFFCGEFPGKRNSHIENAKRAFTGKGVYTALLSHWTVRVPYYWDLACTFLVAAAFLMAGSEGNRKPRAGGRWEAAEDEALRQGVAKLGAKNWKLIAVDFLGGKRTDVQCLHRWQKGESADSSQCVTPLK